MQNYKYICSMHTHTNILGFILYFSIFFVHKVSSVLHTNQLRSIFLLIIVRIECDIFQTKKSINSPLPPPCFGRQWFSHLEMRIHVPKNTYSGSCYRHLCIWHSTRIESRNKKTSSPVYGGSQFSVRTSPPFAHILFLLRNSRNA